MRRRNSRTSTSGRARLGSVLLIGAVLTLGIGGAQGAFASDAPEPTTTSATAASTAASTSTTASASTTESPSTTASESATESASTTESPSATDDQSTATSTPSSATSLPSPTTSAPTASSTSTTPTDTSTVALAAAPRPAAAAAAAACTPGPIAVKPTIVVVPEVVHVGDIVGLTITFTTPTPCPGDHLDVTMPPQFTDLGDFSFPFVDPDGNVLGTATITGDQLVIVLSDSVAGMSELTLTGSYNQRISRDASEGEDTIHFPTSGGDVPVPITVLPCVGSCERLPTQATKSGRLVGDHLEMVGQTPTFALPTTYGFTETLTSPGQEFVCPVTVTARSFTGRDSTGAPTGPRGEPVTITSCTSTQIVGTSETSRPNSFARLSWDVQVTSDQVPSWTDELSIATTRVWTVEAEVKRQTGIGTGQGQFDTTTTSTTTTTTSTTSTTTTPSTTPSTTTPPTTTPVTTPPELAFTGSEVTPLVLSALVLLALGSALLLWRPRGRHS